jgi:hypothetical protein
VGSMHAKPNIDGLDRHGMIDKAWTSQVINGLVIGTW